MPSSAPNKRPCEVAPRSPLTKLRFSQQLTLCLLSRTFFVFLLLTRGGKLRANLLLFTDHIRPRSQPKLLRFLPFSGALAVRAEGKKRRNLLLSVGWTQTAAHTAGQAEEDGRTQGFP